MTFLLEFRLNACPICLICLDCQNIYGQSCICQAREIVWRRKKVERDYMMDFCHRPLTQKEATSQKVVLDSDFVEWVFANVSSQIKLSPVLNNVNICQKCMKGYRDKKNGILYV
ncbi:hypothetical protein GLOIN_2v1783223 [Rhizophagus clarus]|uniref:Uncharacterized protein n=1 Tax=Rhizophagus clarus TaxID=94130 RepID=A0A8H3KTP8_9GLOM|nr:hypothetical protein GLOIN_2v1783223 [Rhizophagus clarus]